MLISTHNNRILRVTTRIRMRLVIARQTITQVEMVRLQMEAEYSSSPFREEPAVYLSQNRKLQFKLNLNKQLKLLM